MKKAGFRGLLPLLALFLSVMGHAQVGGPDLSFGKNERGALRVTVNDRDLVVDARGWNGTDWSVTGRLLAEVIHVFDRSAEVSLRSTPIHLYQVGVKAPNQTYPEMVEQTGATAIYLATERNYWCQYVYQFGHEYLHYLLERTYHRDDRFGWFEEALGELAGLYALEELGLTDWKQPQLNDYRHHFTAYVDQLTDDAAPTVPTPTLTALLADYLTDLEADRYDRPKNREVAVRLLPFFRQDPGLWGAVAYLGQVDGRQCASFADYVTAWLDVLPPDLRERVAGLGLLS